MSQDLTERFELRLSSELLEALKHRAKQERRTVSDTIRLLLEAGLKKYGFRESTGPVGTGV